MVLCPSVEDGHKYPGTYFKLLCLSMGGFFFMQISMEVTGSLFACALVMYPGDLTFPHQSDLGRAHFTVEM